MAMSVSEARAEIKSHYERADLIEKRYPDGEITNNEDLAEVKRLLTTIDELEDKLAVLEDAEARKNRITDGLFNYTKPAPNALIPNHQAGEVTSANAISPGDQFVRSREYREMKASGAFNSSLVKAEFAVNFEDGTSLIQWGRAMKMAQKTILREGSATSGGAWTVNDRLPGYVDILQRDIVVLDLIPRVPTSSDTVEYVTESTFTNNAAFTVEATGSASTGTTGRKPESALAYATATSSVKTLAHWLPVTNQMLADAPAIRGIINGRLLLGLDLTLESQILSGNGSGANFTGITVTSGINVQGLGTDNRMDAIFKARTLVRVNGKGRPGAVLLHPNDWQDIRLTRENASTGTLGGYLMGPPSQIGPTTVFGIPAVESEALSAGTGLVGDFQQGCSLFDREQAAVRVGTINDQFIRNLQTILAELRAAFVVWRPAMFTKITGI